MTTITAFLIAIGLMAASATVAAALLRAARCPGWPVLGGLVAGLVIGATILGRVAPDFWSDVFVGAQDERRAMDVHVIARGGAPLNDDERSTLEAAVDRAEDEHRQPMRWAVAALGGIVLLLGGLGTSSTNEPRQSFLAPATIGLWSALLPGGVAFTVNYTLFEFGMLESMLVGAAVAIGPWRLERGDADAASRAELGGQWLLVMAGRCASVAALLSIAVVIVLERPHHAAFALALLGVPAGWALQRMSFRSFDWWCRWILLPLLGAFVMVRVDLIDDFALWPALLLVLLSGDGRWLGAFLGATIPGGRAGLRAMKLIMGAMAAGPAQMALAALAVQLEWVSGSSAIALALGIVVMEISAPARAATVQRIESIEDEFSSD